MCITDPKGTWPMNTRPETASKMSSEHMLTLILGVLLGAVAPAALALTWPPLITVGAILVGIAFVITGAVGLGRSIQDTPAEADEPVSAARSSIELEGVLDPKLSRWMWLVKWLLAIPHSIVLVILWIAFVIVTMAAGFAVLFTGRYPAPLFQFSTGVLRWNWRVAFYANGVLGSDKYPPFTLARTAYPATFEVAYPSSLSRWKVLFKTWLFPLPHLLIVSLATGGTWAAWTGGRGETFSLLGLLLLVAAMILLFTGVYELGLFNLIMGAHRWMYRVFAYTALMRDEYPPFRLDQGPLEK
jgi:hypothetical protein